jgi:3-phenylpropionate/cinnamic acid dioxygenase small subunit
VNRYELRSDIENFLYTEAELLDDRRFTEWLDLLAEDIVYFMPIQRNVKFGEESQRQTREGVDISWVDEDKWTLSKRVEQLMTGVHWAEEPASRVSHFVTNVQIKNVQPSEEAPERVLAASRFLIYQNRVDIETALFAGKRLDTLRIEDGAWKIARREITLDQSVLLAKNLTVFF